MICTVIRNIVKINQIFIGLIQLTSNVSLEFDDLKLVLNLCQIAIMYNIPLFLIQEQLKPFTFSPDSGGRQKANDPIKIRRKHGTTKL